MRVSRCCRGCGLSVGPFKLSSRRLEASSSALPPPPPVPPSADGVGGVQWDKVYERALATDRALSSQQETLASVQRQQVALVQRVAEIEDMALALQAQVSEARRAVGEVALQQHNVELLMQQMEQRVLQATSATTCAAASASARGEGPARGVEARESEVAERQGVDGAAAAEPGVPFTDALRSEVLAMIREVISKEGAALRPRRPVDLPAKAEHAATTATATATATTPADTSAAAGAGGGAGGGGDGEERSIASRLAELDRRLTTLDAYVDQLALHKIDLANAAAAGGSLASRKDGDPRWLQRTADRVAKEIRLAEAVPFKDITGATRLASQVVVLRNVPANMSPAEVREMCAHACGAHDVISCVVHRERARADAEDDDDGGEEGEEEEGEEVEEEEEEGDDSDDSDGSDGSDGSGGGDDAPSERVFRVTFASTASAVRAIAELNGLELRSAADPAAEPPDEDDDTTMDVPATLVVEPLVSADIQAAVHMLHGAHPPDEVRGSE